MVGAAWGTRRLGDLVTLTSGQSPSRFVFGASGIPYYKVDQLGRTSKYLYGSSTPYLATRMPTVPSGSVLIAKRGGAIALDRIRLTTLPSFMDTNVMALTPGAELEAEYLFYWLSYRGLWDIADVTSVPQINNKHINPLAIELPDSDEQARIVNALRDADELITSLERLIAKKRAIKQGLMQELLTGRSRLDGFTESWTARPLGDLLAYEQPGRYLVSSADYTEIGVPVLTAGKTFLLGYTQEQDGVYEAVPVVIFDDFTTASKYVTHPFKAKSSAMKMLCARPGVNLRFVFERMQLINFVAVDHKRRWIAEYSKIQIAVPGVDEQDAIAAVIEDADGELGVLCARLVKARSIKQGMMQQLLTGRVRLPAGAAI
ncbi:restriction endonuclease subunit S [Paramicrobacterium agarici]|uniref:restriction endonuclease subunit S n=1 Tax=Paramicrobacterium agarici TaxID=630514 RepID=UPI00114E42E0|nr:restriction endonuclease subunit S [Microbacterium agarici]TQO21464.1 type I restriction enzyme S subunit [Microbacterium agarici]